MFGRRTECGLILGRGDWQGAKTPFNLCTPAHRTGLRMRKFGQNFYVYMDSGVHPLQWTGKRVGEQTQTHLQVLADGQMNYI